MSDKKKSSLKAMQASGLRHKWKQGAQNTTKISKQRNPEKQKHPLKHATHNCNTNNGQQRRHATNHKLTTYTSTSHWTACTTPTCTTAMATLKQSDLDSQSGTHRPQTRPGSTKWPYKHATEQRSNAPDPTNVSTRTDVHDNNPITRLRHATIS